MCPLGRLDRRARFRAGICGLFVGSAAAAGRRDSAGRRLALLGHMEDGSPALSFDVARLRRLLVRPRARRPPASGVPAAPSLGRARRPRRRRRSFARCSSSVSFRLTSRGSRPDDRPRRARARSAARPTDRAGPAERSCPNRPPEAPGEVHNLGPAARVPPGEGRTFWVQGREIAVFRDRRRQVFASQSWCPHHFGSLGDGAVGYARSDLSAARHALRPAHRRGARPRLRRAPDLPHSRLARRRPPPHSPRQLALRRVRSGTGSRRPVTGTGYRFRSRAEL